MPGTSGPDPLSDLRGGGGPRTSPAFPKCGAMVITKSGAELLRLRRGDKMRRAVAVGGSGRTVEVVRVMRLGVNVSWFGRVLGGALIADEELVHSWSPADVPFGCVRPPAVSARSMIIPTGLAQ